MALILRGKLTKESFENFITTACEVSCNVSKDGCEGPDTEWGMLRNCEVVFTTFKCGEAKMTAGLTGDGIAELAKNLGEIAPRKIAGKPHTAMTSSRTWWSRTIFGERPSSK